MATIAEQLMDLRRRVEALPIDAGAGALLPFENEARALLTASQNTPYKDDAQTLLTMLVKRGAQADIAPAPVVSGRRAAPSGTAKQAPASDSAALKTLLRRARIRMELAADDGDYDQAVDILADALDKDAGNAETRDLLQQAAQHNPSLAMRVRDILGQHGLDLDLPEEIFEATTPPLQTTQSSAAPSQAESGEYAAPSNGEPPRSSTGSSAIFNSAPATRSTFTAGLGSSAGTPSVEALINEMTQSYYAGDYAKTVELANRILSVQADNPTALDYRQKSEDNLMRGVVPDHRIPFDARVAYNRANSLVRAGNYDEAERLYREARELADRAGIAVWKDVEQALLDIQDLSLARELLNDGDRLLAGDDWSGARQKYEGALKVVSSDPVAQDRLNLIRNIQDQYNRMTVELSTLSGSPSDRATTIQAMLAELSQLRQMLPGSPKLQGLVQDATKRLSAIKNQLLEQGQSALTRAEAASIIDDKARLASEAARILEQASALDNSDLETNALLQTARQLEARVQDARQTLERASALLAQNYADEIAQARTLLVNLREYSADPRYRVLISELLSRHLESVESALDRRDVPTADRWLSLAKDDLFRTLGRRSEIGQLEGEIQALKRARSLRGGAIAGGIVIILFALGLISRPLWTPLIYPPTNTPTATATLTFTPSSTPTVTPTSTITLTPSYTPTSTYTLTPTFTETSSLTPSLTYTLTPSKTLTPTFTPSITLTPTDTFTPSFTPSMTYTPSVTPTSPVLCTAIVVRGDVFVQVHSRPATAGSVITQLRQGQTMNVLQQQIGQDDGRIWYQISFAVEGNQIQGWVRSDLVSQTSPCPSF